MVWSALIDELNHLENQVLFKRIFYKKALEAGKRHLSYMINL